MRPKVNEKYGDAVQSKTGPIRADLLGNMWSQEWGNIYDVVTPKDGAGLGYDLTKQLEAKGYTPQFYGEDGGELLHLARLRPLAQDLLGAIHDSAPARSRGAVPRLGLGDR